LYLELLAASSVTSTSTTPTIQASFAKESDFFNSLLERSKRHWRSLRRLLIEKAGAMHRPVGIPCGNIYSPSIFAPMMAIAC
jgi:hypothetical protein